MQKTLICAALLIIFLSSGAASNQSVGFPSFAPVSSSTMTLQYGFNGAAVQAGGRWYFHSMTTITRSAVQGRVNQVNDTLALAAGLYEIAVFDFSKKQWMVFKRHQGKNISIDDSTAQLSTNLVLTADTAKVRILNGPFAVYTRDKGWSTTQ